MRLQDIIMREAPSAYIFDSDGAVHRNRPFPEEVGDTAVAVGETVVGSLAADLPQTSWKVLNIY